MWKRIRSLRDQTWLSLLLSCPFSFREVINTISNNIRIIFKTFPKALAKCQCFHIVPTFLSSALLQKESSQLNTISFIQFLTKPNSCLKPVTQNCKKKFFFFLPSPSSVREITTQRTQHTLTEHVLHVVCTSAHTATSLRARLCPVPHTSSGVPHVLFSSVVFGLFVALFCLLQCHGLITISQNADWSPLSLLSIVINFIPNGWSDNALFSTLYFARRLLQ